MKNISLLDCTLRDGAHINKGNFGKDRSIRIYTNLIKAGIEYIELGNLEPKSSYEGSTYFDTIDEAVNFFNFKNLSKNSNKRGLMTRVDRCDISRITPNKYIDFIRIAFYPEHLKDLIKYAEKILDCGYKLYLNLIAVTNYGLLEIDKLFLNLSKSISYDGLSIVDSYGSLSETKLKSLIPIFEKYLKNENEFGLHLHENLNRSSSLYKVFIKNTSKTKLIIDASLGGMGRVPGNFPTEVCANLINEDFRKDYLITNLIQLASEEVQEFQNINKWGYIPIYATSAILNIDRSYPEYFSKVGLSDKKNIYAQELVANEFGVKKFSKEIAKKVILMLDDKNNYF